MSIHLRSQAFFTPDLASVNDKVYRAVLKLFRTAASDRRLRSPGKLPNLTKALQAAAAITQSSQAGDAAIEDLSLAVKGFAETVLFSSPDDFYRVLGLNQDAGADEIRRHYEWLSLLLFPATRPGIWSEYDALLLNKAYGVLRDAQARRRYDQCHDSRVESHPVPADAVPQADLDPGATMEAPHGLPGPADAPGFIASNIYRVHPGPARSPDPAPPAGRCFEEEGETYAPGAGSTHAPAAECQGGRPCPPAASPRSFPPWKVLGLTAGALSGAAYLLIQAPGPISAAFAPRAAEKAVELSARERVEVPALDAPIVTTRAADFLSDHLRPMPGPRTEETVLIADSAPPPASSEPPRPFAAMPEARATVGRPDTGTSKARSVPSRTRPEHTPGKAGAKTAAAAAESIPRGALAALTKRFVASYQSGNLQEFIGLFAPDAASGPQHDVHQIYLAYERFFKRTTQRRLELADIKWKARADGILEGRAPFRADMNVPAEGDTQHHAGTLVFLIQTHPGMLIKRVDFEYDR